MTFPRLRGLLVLPLLAAIAFAAPAAADPLAGFPAGQRVLLLFASAGDNSILADQIDRLEPYDTALVRKNLVPVIVIGNERVVNLKGDDVLPPETAAALRERFQVAAEAAFAGVIVDETGAVIWEGGLPVAMSEIIVMLPDPEVVIGVDPELVPQVGPGADGVGLDQQQQPAQQQPVQ
jgi:hypothetical protein